MTAIRATAPLLTLLLACASSGTGDGSGDPIVPGGSGPGTVSAYCDQFWGAYATRWAECDRASLAQAAAIYSPGDLCQAGVQAVSAGRATYDATHAAACLSFVQTATCEILQAYMEGDHHQADCDAAIAGTLADGATCYSNESCASGVCFMSPGQCPSFCASPVPSGQPCEAFRPCAEGTFCNFSTGTCAPLVALDGGCNTPVVCAPGLACLEYATSDYRCLPRKTTGTCYTDEACATGYECYANACRRVLGPGEACTQGLNACGPGLWCGNGGTCVDGPTTTQGCGAVAGESRPCIGSWCQTTMSGSTCVAWSGEGSACSLSSECGPNQACLGDVTKVCTSVLCAEP
ncbi:MAG TPA: Dickkopf N-terminal cysteine-rich domain-containing protein [Anaeromyxobacteraceae bacterium]|nr:Dickkopf N-terminal cysteine-rich domain-containing protein [Anaeromyxobacteraceae bacterium]